MILDWDINSNDGSVTQMQKCMQDFKHLRPYYYGDYYPLIETQNMTHDDVWLAYQLNKSEQSDGIIVAFRRKDAFEESIHVKLRGLNAKANYEVYKEDSGTKINITGGELINGFTLFMSEKPYSLLISYKML